jgi:hypothetical protein
MKQITQILKELYHLPTGKEKLAELLNVKTTKTIENNILKYNKMEETTDKEIIYDMKLRKYRFNISLPSFVPSNIIFTYMSKHINNTYIKDDFIDVLHYVENDTKNKCDTTLIPTQKLSPLLQKIIQVELALKYNMSIKMDYLGNRGDLEIKYIKPHHIYFNGYTHYLYASYHEDNIVNIGEMRTFSLNGIKSLEFHKLEDETLSRKIIGNAWGEYTNSIILHISGSAAIYFRRENIFNDSQFDLMSLEDDNSLIVKMHYKNENDIINLMQKWMPNITIHKHSEVSDRIYQKIKENYVDLTIQRELNN